MLLKSTMVKPPYGFALDQEGFTNCRDVAGAVTLIFYSYRDLSYFTRTGHAIIGGVVSPDVLSYLNSQLYEEDYILPTQLGLPKLRRMTHARDHELHKIESVEFMSRMPETEAHVVDIGVFCGAVMALRGDHSWDIGAAKKAALTEVKAPLKTRPSAESTRPRQRMAKPAYGFAMDNEGFALCKGIEGAVTVIDYTYKDLKDFTRTGQAVVYGVVSPDVLAHLNSHLYEDDYFLPTQLGLPKLRVKSHEDDHELHKIHSVTYETSMPNPAPVAVGLDSFCEAVLKLSREHSWDERAAKNLEVLTA